MDDRVYEKYITLYRNIVDQFYPSLGNTGFQERNLTVNFSKAYESVFPEDNAFSWFELQFGDNYNNHFDCLIVNPTKKEILFIESKRFTNTTSKRESILKDIDRINCFARSGMDQDDRFDNFKQFDVYGLILADVWLENKKKKDVYYSFAKKEFFKNETRVSAYTQEYYVADCPIHNFNCSAPYALLSFLWKIK